MGSSDKKRHTKGQNRKRPRDKAKKLIETLCPALIKETECKFGDQCKFSHDKLKFWESRSADLASECPNFSRAGYCTYGLMCRFASSHVDPKSLKNLRNDLVADKAVIREFNMLRPDLRLSIRKKQLQYNISRQIMNQIMNKMTAERKSQMSENGLEKDLVDSGVIQKVYDNNIGSEIRESVSYEDGQKNNSCDPSNQKPEISNFNDGHGVNGIDLNCTTEQNQRSESTESGRQEANPEQREKLLGAITDESVYKPRERQLPDVRGRLYLAPLTTIGNLPFRRICVEHGADITCGEMAFADNLLAGNQGEWSLVRRHECEKMFGVQLAGSKPEILARATELLLTETDVDFIDLNLGCPIDLVCNKGAGCMLMKRATRLQECTSAMAGVIDAPDSSPFLIKMERNFGNLPYKGSKAFLSIKMRTGVSDGSPIAAKVIAGLKDKASLFSLHGRSREQRYTKVADWDYIGRCATAADPVPLFGCGDVLNLDEYESRLAENPHIAGIMLARGAMIKPWLFTEIKERRVWDISSRERFDMLEKYAQYGLEHWGSDQQGVDRTRRFMLEWLSFLHRYIPVGILERTHRINEKPPAYFCRDELETMFASKNCKDWIQLTERTVLGKVPDDFEFLPKHKANSYS